MKQPRSLRYGHRAHLPPFVYHTLLLWQACLRAAGSGRRALARGPKLCLSVTSEYYIIVKTFNNGSLGSGIDEERSEMR